MSSTTASSAPGLSWRRWAGLAATAVLLAAVALVPYYVLARRYFPALRRCEYLHDNVSLRDWEGSTSFVLSPFTAALLTYLGTRALGRRSLCPTVVVLVLTTVALVVFAIHENPNCPD